MATTKKTPDLSVAIAAHDEAERITITHSVLTLEFANGKILTLDTRELSPEIISHALAHGLKQKLVDSAAMSRDPSNGRAAGVDVKMTAVREVLERLLAGEWNKRREGGGATGGLLFRALCILYEGRKTPEQLKEFLAGKSDKEKAALRKNSKVAAIIEELRAADSDGAEADDLLAELEDMDGEGAADDSDDSDE